MLHRHSAMKYSPTTVASEQRKSDSPGFTNPPARIRLTICNQPIPHNSVQTPAIIRPAIGCQPIPPARAHTRMPSSVTETLAPFGAVILWRSLSAILGSATQRPHTCLLTTPDRRACSPIRRRAKRVPEEVSCAFPFSISAGSGIRERRPISRVLSWTTIYLGSALPRASNGLPGSCSEAGRLILPYLAFLRAGFALPPLSPEARCALTAPFHPYLSSSARRYLFCGTFPGITPGPR